MSLIDKVLDDNLFKHFADKLNEKERAYLEKTVREMLSTADGLYGSMQALSADEKGKLEIADALEYLISEEGQKTWQQDKS